MGEIQPSRERLVEIGVREDTHLLLEVGYLLLPESRPKVVDHQGYKLAFLGFAISHLRPLESFRRPSLQRIPGAVGLRPDPGGRDLSLSRSSRSTSGSGARRASAFLIPLSACKHYI